MFLEICVDSILSAKNASKAGADRIELCSALSEGGLTPSLGLFRGVKKALQNSKTKIFCMIRIRRGNFNYDDDEVESMTEDVRYFKENGADGIVFGFLDNENQIDVKNTQKIINAWGSNSMMTFHRAFDETRVDEYEKTIDILAGLGFDRILSSGFESSAEVGIENLKKMVEYSINTSVTILCGAGINEKNVEKIVLETGCKEIHGSARSELKSVSNKLSMGGGQSEGPLMVCDRLKVEEMLRIMKTVSI